MKIAIIGCGPSGMFVVHALELIKQSMISKSDIRSLESLPIVKCFEKSHGPGGIWRRDHRSFQSFNFKNGNGGTHDASTKMYEALWTNGPKENFEFHDYTFDQHFDNAPLPTYLPRSLVLDYIMGRVSQNDTNDTSFFEKDDIFQFNANVKSVIYSEDKFTLEIEHNNNNRTGVLRTIETFDKCVWAAGTNGVPVIPSRVKRILRRGKYRGKALHSSDVGGIDFKNLVKNKNIVLIGSAYSAEDLALQSIKLGVNRVYIAARSGEGASVDTASWPKDKVEILRFVELVEVLGDKTLKFSAGDWGPNVYLEDVAVVIYCTGYESNFDMLEDALHPSLYYEQDSAIVPEGWTMKPNVLTQDLGNIKPDDKLSSYYGLYNVYNGLLMTNPSMMFFNEHKISIPLLEIDVQAWSVASYMTGKVPIPSLETMKYRRKEREMDWMNSCWHRCTVDSEYSNALSKMLPDDHWYHQMCYDLSGSALKKLEIFYYARVNFDLKWLGAEMLETKNPFQLLELHPDLVEEDDNGRSIIEKLKKYRLNDKARSIAKAFVESDMSRCMLDPSKKEWITFRDVLSDSFVSIHSKVGAKSVPLKKNWMDLDEDAYEDYSRKKGNWTCFESVDAFSCGS